MDWAGNEEKLLFISCHTLTHEQSIPLHNSPPSVGKNCAGKEKRQCSFQLHTNYEFLQNLPTKLGMEWALNKQKKRLFPIIH